jgi:hypothetical protein
MRHRWTVTLVVVAFAAVALSACATIPSGPSVMVLPAPGKPFEQFQVDDAVCRQWAQQQIGIAPSGVAAQSTVNTATLGTVLGAGLGAAIGAASGSPGVGAAIGAGGGLLGGTLVGAGAGQASGWEAQRRYDMAYQQCMYAKGNQIPGVSPRPYPYPPPPPYGSPPPPPPSALPPRPPAPGGAPPAPQP